MNCQITLNEEKLSKKPKIKNIMKRIVISGNKTICLFACGFLIGIFLEILLLEKGKFSSLSRPKVLQNKINVTCLILLKNDHEKYVNSSKKTWLKHCDDYYIVKIQKVLKSKKQSSSNTENPKKTENGTSEQNQENCSKDQNFRYEVTAKSAWGGLCKALQITKPSHSQWLIIVPDTLLVLIENLKLFVRNFDCDELHYYGYAVENYEANYNVLSAGILLSRGVLTKLFQTFVSLEDCDFKGKYWRNEDLYLGKYLKQMNIFPKDTRDADGRGRFHGYNMNNILWPGKLFQKSNYNQKALYPAPKGFNCCSPFLITTDVSDPNSIEKLYFLLYKLRTDNKEMPKSFAYKKPKGFFWKDFLKSEGYNESAIENISSEEYYKIWEKKLPPEEFYKEMRDFLKNHKELTEAENKFKED